MQSDTTRRRRKHRPNAGSKELLLSTADLCDLLRIGKSTLYAHLKDGPPPRWRGIDVRLIESVRIGRRTLWLRKSVEALIEG